MGHNSRVTGAGRIIFDSGIWPCITPSCTPWYLDCQIVNISSTPVDITLGWGYRLDLKQVTIMAAVSTHGMRMSFWCIVDVAHADSICSGSTPPVLIPTIPPTMPYLNNVWTELDIYYFIYNWSNGTGHGDTWCTWRGYMGPYTTIKYYSSSTHDPRVMPVTLRLWP